MPSSAEHHCFAHDAGQREAQREARQAGGRARSNASRATKHLPAELQGIPARLLRLLDAVEQEKLTPAQATAFATLVSRLVDVLRFGIEVGESHEFAERLSRLEESISA